jgi:hypothetical protein
MKEKNLKRLISLLLILGGMGMSLGAQEKPKHWWEYFHGISLGMEAGAHEYPLELWYPDQYIEGYSIRSLYLKPSVSYGRFIQDYHFDLTMELTIDKDAPNPNPGASAFSAETSDRELWLTVYLEEKMDYPISRLFTAVNFPGTLAVFLNNENYIYAMPDFPGGKIVEGNMEFGPAAYDNHFKFGWFQAKLGLPLFYVNRFDNDLGFGMNVTLAYKDPIGLGLGVEFAFRSLFVPEPAYSETEFILTYKWKDFLAELDITAEGSFKSASITPKVSYYLKSFTFTLGAEITGIGNISAFSPCLGINWSY